MLLSCPVDPIEEAWAQVETDWKSEEAHRRFVGLCAALDRLPDAGKRYREVRETDPSRREDAIKRIDTLIALAAQQLQDTRVGPVATQHKRTLTWAAFFIMLVLMGAGILLLMRG
jgi:hypothetical protein